MREVKRMFGLKKHNSILNVFQLYVVRILLLNYVELYSCMGTIDELVPYLMKVCGLFQQDIVEHRVDGVSVGNETKDNST